MEIWKDIKGYEGYQVSNYGSVRGLNYNRTGKVKVLSQSEHSNGYLQVVLYKNGKQKAFRVHRLVAEAFLSNLLGYREINHIDEDKHNNFCGTPENNFTDGNLEWCDRKYNINYGNRNERVAEKLSKPVLQLAKNGELVREWSSTMEAGRNGFDHSNIVNCCLGKRKTHLGFRWKFKTEKEVV